MQKSTESSSLDRGEGPAPPVSADFEGPLTSFAPLDESQFTMQAVFVGDATLEIPSD